MSSEEVESTIVICTRNRNSDLSRAFSAYSAFGGERKMLCVDSSDEAIFRLNEKIFIGDSRVMHIRSKPGLTRQRNVALEVLGSSITKESYVHFIDDDVVIEPGYFELLEEMLKDKHVAGATGLDLNLSGVHHSRVSQFVGLIARRQGTLSRFAIPRMISESQPRPFKVSWLSGCSMSFDLKKIKGHLFNEDFVGYCLGEDVWFSYGIYQEFDLVCEPRATYRHNRSQQNRLNEFDRNICDKSHRRAFIAQYSDSFPGNYYSGIFLELFFLMIKWLLGKARPSSRVLIKSNLVAIWRSMTKRDGLFCICQANCDS